jgi:asparagine synthase (glutamine-hydrolysing)
MCGINGIVNNLSKIGHHKATISKMNDVLAHRGPDGEGIFVSLDKHAIFGFRRLAIVDVENGAQPIEIIHNQYHFAIVCNGEIYNHRELRGQLEKKGHTFKSGSDAEVLLISYIEWGEKCLSRLNGAYAFAIYDGKKELIFLARDRVGIKPLYYSIIDGTLIFSSEPKGILCYPGFVREPDVETIAEYVLGTHSFPDGCAPLDRSFFMGIKSLHPGKYGIFKNNTLSCATYWDVFIEKSEGADHEERLRAQLIKAVEIRIPDEVRFGTALSGGLDSSIVTSIVENQQNEEVLSTCVRFCDCGFNPDYEHAQKLASQRRIRLIPTDINAEDLLTYIDPMIRAMDEPHDAIRQLGLFAVYRTLQQAGCKVALVGEGADEFNLGYYQTYPGFFIDEEGIKKPEHLHNALANKIPLFSHHFTDEFLKSVDFEKIITSIVENHYEKCQSAKPIDRMQYYYCKKFLKYRLDANDRCGMAHSIEARVPFCDHNVVEASIQISDKLNIAKGTEKNVLREAFKDTLPKEIIERRKYPLPENTEIAFYRLIAKKMDETIASMHPSFWNLLKRESILELSSRFKEKIDGLEIKEVDMDDLTSEVPLGEESDVKIKHVFGILTLMRWYQIYF